MVGELDRLVEGPAPGRGTWEAVRTHAAHPDVAPGPAVQSVLAGQDAHRLKLRGCRRTMKLETAHVVLDETDRDGKARQA